MKHLAVLALVLLMAPVVVAARLDGVVTDRQNRPLADVSVVTNISGIGTSTDEDGAFRLKADDEVTRITFSSIGYRSRQFSRGQLPDTVVLELMYYPQEKIVVTAGRAERGLSPVAFDNVSRDDIERDYLVGEFPLLLETTPNLYSYADAGSSMGYAYVKIRGFDDRRIITYINGVPLNDPEDHGTYFVDLPDFTANITDIQVQRGVGNSLYGDASFGGLINIVTSSFNRPRKTTLSAGYGVYTSGGKSVSDIYKQSIEYSSGLIDGRWLYGGRFSKQKTGGYRYNSWYEGWSYYFSVGRLDPHMTTELHIYGGPMRMHLAYYGVGRDDLKDDRRTNPLTYNNATDNFNQPHYQLHHVYEISDRMTLSNTLYYIRGKGYYEQFKSGRDYYEYDLTSVSDSSKGDLVRQKHVTKNQVGWNTRLRVEHENGSHTLGGSFYYFESDHWGQVVAAQYLHRSVDPTRRYYEYFGKKSVASVYGQEIFQLTDKMSFQATAQLRYLRYSLDQVRRGAFKGHDYEIDWLFVSPRLGINYAFDERFNLFGSFAVSSRTPTDEAIFEADDPWRLPSLEIESYTEPSPGDTVYQFGDPTARAERLYDLEIGGQYRVDRYSLSVNLYWMEFLNEIIPDGGVNDDGMVITVNADRSVHAGVELTGAMEYWDGLHVSANFAYSNNRIKKYTGLVDGYEIDFKDKKTVGFPDYLGNIVADYAKGDLRLTGRVRFVGKQYVELYNIDSLSIDPFIVLSASASYTFKNFLDVGNLTLSGRVDNLLDKKYETAAYGENYAYENGSGNVVVEGWAGYFVAAERTFYTQLKLQMF